MPGRLREYMQMPPGIRLFRAWRRDSTFYIFRHIFFFYIHQNDIIPHLADITEGNYILLFPTQETADTSGTGYDKGQHAASLHIKIHIPHKTQTFAGLHINNFFLVEIINSRSYPSGCFLLLIYAAMTWIRIPDPVKGGFRHTPSGGV